MSRILVDQIRSNSASADAITLDGSGNLTIPGNATISGTATGFGGGKVLQAVTASTSTLATTTGITYEDTNLTASITISANSKVLILVTQNYEVKRGPKVFAAGDIRLVRGSTNIWVSTNQKMLGFGDGDSDYKTLLGVLSICFLDTNASTGSNTYKTQQRVQSQDDNPRIRTQDDSNPSTITLLEIGA
jgi:hypothetical protein